MATRTKTKPESMQPREPASVTHEGELYALNPRDIYASDHPVVKKYPDLFKPIEPLRQRPEVEQATAAPGEKRGAKR